MQRSHLLDMDCSKEVSFGVVAVREFNQVLEAHPSCSSGPGIGLGWKFTSKATVPVDAWEDVKQKEERKMEKLKRFSCETSSRSSTRSLLLTERERERIAKRNGFTNEDIQSNMRKIKRASIRRQRSFHAVLEEKASEEGSLEIRMRRAIEAKKNKQQCQLFKSTGQALSA